VHGRGRAAGQDVGERAWISVSWSFAVQAIRTKKLSYPYPRALPAVVRLLASGQRGGAV
jgi:hypothetical protein